MSNDTGLHELADGMRECPCSRPIVMLSQRIAEKALKETTPGALSRYRISIRAFTGRVFVRQHVQHGPNATTSTFTFSLETRNNIVARRGRVD